MTMLKSKIQNVIDKLLASLEDGAPPSQSDVDTFLSWIEVDGWDECVKSWSDINEPVVFSWPEFVDKFANDSSVTEYHDIELSEIADIDRINHFRERIRAIYEDPSAGFSVHPLVGISSNGVLGILGVIVGLEGYSNNLRLFGVFRSIEEALGALPELGLERCDAIISDNKILSVWNTSNENEKDSR